MDGVGTVGQAVVRIEGYVGVGDCLNEVLYGQADCEDEDRRAVRTGVLQEWGSSWRGDVDGGCMDREL